MSSVFALGEEAPGEQALRQPLHGRVVVAPARRERRLVAPRGRQHEGVAGEASLNQPDGVHPTARGQAIMAETVWGVVGPILDRTG